MKIYDEGERKREWEVKEGDVIIDNGDTYFIVMREIVRCDHSTTGFAVGPWRLVNLTHNKITRHTAASLEELLSSFGKDKIKEVIPTHRAVLKIER